MIQGEIAMQLDYLCEMELSYRAEPLSQRHLVLVRPYGSEEGSAYGEGDGTVSGPALQGRVRWVNHPHRRSDGVMLPDAHGVIMTEDGAAILFTLQGRTVFAQGQGQQLLTVLFETEAEAYRWLNTTVCLLEGLISSGMTHMQARIYVCRSDLPQLGGH
jgi:hypothetical protein